MADSSISIMGKLGPALQESGLGPEAISNVVKGVTDGIAHMDTAQKAFLSSQTGGAGGLMGAFQIDQMLAEGKIDQVFDKVKQNMMQKIGGPLVNRAQAAQSQEAASQYQKQLMFMQSPAMGGIAKDPASASKLLEAMTSGKGIPTNLTNKEDALRNTLSRGTSLQERGNSYLNIIANWTQRQSQLGAISNYGTSRFLLGSENTQFNEPSNKESRRANAATGVDGRTIPQVINEVNYKKDASDIMNNAMGAMRSITQTIKDKATGEVNPLPGMPGVNPSSLDHSVAPSSKPINPIQLASRSFNKANNNQATQPTLTNHTSSTEVHVTSVCSVCLRKIASEEANKAVGHAHNQGVQRNFTGTNL